MACEICKKPYKAPSKNSSVDFNEKPHVCNVCGKSFSLKIQLKRHVLFHEEDAPYICNTCEKHLEQTSYNLRLSKKGNFTCETCSKSFPSKRLLLRHASEHTLENALNCNECGECFKNATALKKHAAVHKPKKKDSKGNPRKQTSSHLCNNCGKRFSQLQQLEKHQLTHQYHCGICGVDFTSSNLLKKHKANGSCESKNGNSMDISNENVDDKKHACDICNKSFTRKSALEGHVVSHFTDGRESTVEDDSDIDADFECNYKDDKSIEQPKRQCLPKLKIRRSFPCEICKVVCASKKMFDKHMASHEKTEKCEEKKSYTCRICNNVFDSKEVYRVHKLSHETKEDAQDNKEAEQESLKKYTCIHCKAKFPKKRHLRKHLKSHFNVDPNGTASLSLEEMQTGKKRIKRLKNFECSVCGKRFAGETCLKRHEAKHDGSGESDSLKGKKDKKSSLNLVCEFCEEDFTGRKHAFFKHKLSHTPEVCGICDARFVDRPSLREHCRIHVGTEEGRRFMECSQKALDAKNGVAAPEPKVEYIYLVLR